MIYQGLNKYPVKEVILHCAAINTGQFDGFSPFQVFTTVNRWHRERGFKNGFGYHGLFLPDGTFFSGRPFGMIGAHCIERNRGSLGFLLIEKRKIKDLGHPLEYFTDVQLSSVNRAIRALPGIELVSGHNDYAHKLCPGFRVREHGFHAPLDPRFSRGFDSKISAEKDFVDLSAAFDPAHSPAFTWASPA